jgi:hypothetical protein
MVTSVFAAMKVATRERKEQGSKLWVRKNFIFFFSCAFTMTFFPRKTQAEEPA